MINLEVFVQFNIEINYEDKVEVKNAADFELTVKAVFDDDSAKLVGEVLANFNEKFVEIKNKARYMKTS